MLKLYSIGITCLLLLLCSNDDMHAQASLLDSGVPANVSGVSSSAPSTVNLISQLPNQSNGSFSDLDCDFCPGIQIMADNFTVSSTIAFNEVTWWGGYFPDNLIPVSGGTFNFAVYSDVAGQPDPTGPFAGTTFTLAGVDTGIDLFGVDELEYSAVAALLTLTPGTYWFSIFNNTSGSTDSWFWEVGNLDLTNGVPGNAFSTEDPPVWQNGGGDLAFRLANTLLPVELSSFQSSVAGNIVTLDWQTQSEDRNAGFEVEVSHDGSYFSTLGFVEGHGTTTEVHDYSFTYRSDTPGKHFFRLRQIDTDGINTYSDILEVDTEIPDGLNLQAVYPNPFISGVNNGARTSFAVENDSEVRVELVNSLGQIVSVLFEGTASANQRQQVNIETSQLESGLYFVRMTTAFGVKTSSLTVID